MLLLLMMMVMMVGQRHITLRQCNVIILNPKEMSNISCLGDSCTPPFILHQYMRKYIFHPFLYRTLTSEP